MGLHCTLIPSLADCKASGSSSMGSAIVYIYTNFTKPSSIEEIGVVWGSRLCQREMENRYKTLVSITKPTLTFANIKRS